ncbi:MAG: nidogen-like domain-containing protein, partial [Flavobacteriales bacterium]
LPFDFSFYGNDISSMWININGNVSFNGPYWQFSPVGFPNDNFEMIAPFWGDVDLGGTGEIWYYFTPDAIYVNWVGVGYYNEETDKINTFQLILTDGTNPLIGIGNNVAFNYDDMSWTTGAASDGVNGFGGSPATVGVNEGNGDDFFQIGRFDHPGVDYDGPGGSTDGVDYLDGQCITFSTEPETNINPVVLGSPSNNLIELCDDEEGSLDLEFTGPENDQTVSVDIQSTIPGFSIDQNTSGSVANTEVSFGPVPAGSYTITYTATDDFATPGVTTLVINVEVSVCCVPEIIINCPGDVVQECSLPFDPAQTGEAQYTVTDCTDPAQLSFSDDLSYEDCDAIITRTWTVTAGAISQSCNQTIRLQDTTPPVLQNLPAQHVEVNCEDGLPIIPTVTAVDNCGQMDLPQFSEHTNDSNPCEIQVTRTWSIEDQCGNTANFSQVITVIDDVDPVWGDLPQANLIVSCEDGFPNAPTLTATDNCSGSIVAVLHTDFNNDDPCDLIKTRTWTATDDCGNSIEFVQTIHKIDDVDPVWNDLPQSEVTYSCGDQVPGAFDLTANDNCAGLIHASVHSSTNDNDPCDVVITRTYTAADGCGNSIEFVQTIHV